MTPRNLLPLLALGLFAWGVDQALLVDLNYELFVPLRTAGLMSAESFDATGQPRLLAYLAYF